MDQDLDKVQEELANTTKKLEEAKKTADQVILIV